MLQRHLLFLRTVPFLPKNAYSKIQLCSLCSSKTLWYLIKSCVWVGLNAPIVVAIWVTRRTAWARVFLQPFFELSFILYINLDTTELKEMLTTERYQGRNPSNRVPSQVSTWGSATSNYRLKDGSRYRVVSLRRGEMEKDVTNRAWEIKRE